MIKSFKGRHAKSLFEGICPKGFPPDVLKAARRKLEMVEAAAELNDLKVPPGNKLKPLTDDRKGQHSIRINDKWRVCFRWERGAGAWDVEVVDYHD